MGNGRRVKAPAHYNNSIHHFIVPLIVIYVISIIAHERIFTGGGSGVPVKTGGMSSFLFVNEVRIPRAINIRSSIATIVSFLMYSARLISVKAPSRSDAFRVCYTDIRHPSCHYLHVSFKLEY